MASYLIYVPGRKAADADTLRSLGLGELVRDRGPDCAELSVPGPDEGFGCLCWFNDPRRPERNPEPVYAPKGQVWRPAKPNPELGLPAARFYFGYEARRPPVPEDLERPTRIRGKQVVLGDGNPWLVPMHRELPHQITMNDEGVLCEFPSEAYADFSELAERIYRWLVPEEGEPGIPLLEAWPVCASVLGYNYRVNRDVCELLGLFRDELALKETCKVVVDFETILELLRQEVERAQKKTAEPDPATCATSPGEAVS